MFGSPCIRVSTSLVPGAYAAHRRAASYRKIADVREQGSPSKPLAGQLLLVAEALVSRHERLVSGELGLPDQLTVLQLAPSKQLFRNVLVSESSSD